MTVFVLICCHFSTLVISAALQTMQSSKSVEFLTSVIAFYCHYHLDGLPHMPIFWRVLCILLLLLDLHHSTFWWWIFWLDIVMSCCLKWISLINLCYSFMPHRNYTSLLLNVCLRVSCYITSSQPRLSWWWLYVVGVCNSHYFTSSQVR